MVSSKAKKIPKWSQDYKRLPWWSHSKRKRDKTGVSLLDAIFILLFSFWLCYLCFSQETDIENSSNVTTLISRRFCYLLSLAFITKGYESLLILFSWIHMMQVFYGSWSTCAVLILINWWPVCKIIYLIVHQSYCTSMLLNVIFPFFPWLLKISLYSYLVFCF